jgi:hypothetical protein
VFSQVEIVGFGAQVRFGDDGGAIVARGARGEALPLLVDSGVVLAPGRYPWPLRFRVRPLVESWASQ